MSSTYGEDGLLNFTSLDRTTTVNSFKCYWQIDNMIVHRVFSHLKVVQADLGINVSDKDKEPSSSGANGPVGEFSLPKLFSVSHDGKWSKDIRGYKFFIPGNYERDPDGKHTLIQEKQNLENFITICVKDPIPID